MTSFYIIAAPVTLCVQLLPIAKHSNYAEDTNALQISKGLSYPHTKSGVKEAPTYEIKSL